MLFQPRELNSQRRTMLGLTLTICVLFNLSASRADEPRSPSLPSLQEQLNAQAPKVLEKLAEHGCTNIGVLKFRVLEPRKGISDNVGTLNRFLAERLEAALTMALPRVEPSPISLARNASQTAEKLSGASHLDELGRQRLLQANYARAWGKGTMKVDALVTGIAIFAADYRSFDIGLVAVEAGSRELKPLLPRFTVATTGAILSEAGHSFQLRSVPNEPESTDPAEAVNRVLADPQRNFPLQNQPSVMLRIFYDDQPVELEFAEDAARIPEPRSGQKVTMRLERTDRQPGALGVVLKVNGVNTLNRERLPDLDCSKWVLSAERPGGVISGFHFTKSDEVEQFRVASTEESQHLAMNYGADVGAISMVVFQEQVATEANGGAIDPLAIDKAPDLMAILKADFPEETPPTADALRSALRGDSPDTLTRGIILEGTRRSLPLDIQRFRWHPEPIMSAVIRYYDPASNP